MYFRFVKSFSVDAFAETQLEFLRRKRFEQLYLIWNVLSPQTTEVLWMTTPRFRLRSGGSRIANVEERMYVVTLTTWSDLLPRPAQPQPAIAPLKKCPSLGPISIIFSSSPRFLFVLITVRVAFPCCGHSKCASAI